MYPKIEWPLQTEVYDFEVDNNDPDLESSLMRLTTETLRYLGSLGMPETLELAFESQAVRHVIPTAQPAELVRVGGNVWHQLREPRSRLPVLFEGKL